MSRNLLVILATLYICIPFNLFLLQSYPIDKFLSYLLSTISIVGIIIYIASFNKWIFRTVSSIFILINGIAAFYYYNYNVVFDFSIIMALANTNLKESWEAFNINILLFVFIFSIIPIVILCYCNIKKYTLKKHVYSFILFILITLLAIISGNIIYKKDLNLDKKKYQLLAKLLPMDFNYNPISYTSYGIKYLTLLKSKVTYKDLTSNTNYNFDQNPTPKIIVLVIGETARADHFHINGYQRNTTPNLDKINNVVSFYNTTSCYTLTIPSVSCLMSNIDGKTFRSNIPYYLKNEVNSFFPIFNKMNFDTYFFSTSHYAPGDPIFKRFQFAKHVNILAENKYAQQITDLLLIPEFKHALANNSKQNKLIVLHTMGSHFKYSSRYDDKHKKWNPICTDKYSEASQCDHQSLINDYDNTIYNTDDLLGQLINLLKNKNSMLIYTSDHGENLGEIRNSKPTFYHGTPWNKIQDQDVHVPFIAWFSNEYLKYNPHVIKHTKSIKHNQLNHDYIFHSVLSCSGISNNKIIDKKLSICN